MLKSELQALHDEQGNINNSVAKILHVIQYEIDKGDFETVKSYSEAISKIQTGLIEIAALNRRIAWEQFQIKI